MRISSWLLGAAATGALPSRPARFRDEPHVGVVLAAGGYPDAPESGKPIDGLDAAQRRARRDRLSCRHRVSATAGSSLPAAAC